MTDQENDKRGAERYPIKDYIEFIVYGDIEHATGIDISQTGLRFASKKPLTVRMRIRKAGESREYLAELIWANKNPQGLTEFGFRFLPDNDTQDF